MIAEASARLWNWIDSRAIVRRATLGVAVWMTEQGFEWAQYYANSSINMAAADKALIIAAVTAPLSAFCGFVFKVYADGRVDDAK
jgi:hypothetical protein